jgi:hypothetical protein
MLFAQPRQPFPVGTLQLGLEFRANLLDCEQPAIGELDGEHDCRDARAIRTHRHHFGYGGREDRISHDLSVLDLPRNTKRITHMARREVRLAILGDSGKDVFA